MTLTATRQITPKVLLPCLALLAAVLLSVRLWKQQRKKK